MAGTKNPLPLGGEDVKSLIPVTVTMMSDSIIRDNIIIYPEVRIEFNDEIVFGPEVIICHNSSFNANFNIKFDVEKDELHKLIVYFHTENSNDIQWNEKTNKQENFGIKIKDLEIHDISMEDIIWSHGIIEAKLSLEQDYNEDGFIHNFILPESRENELQLRSEINKNDELLFRYWWRTNGNYLHGSGTSYHFNFKTPLYIWLLELLLH